jgi:nucleoside-triphosphatase
VPSLLLTGRPGVGKSTLLRSVLDAVAVPAGGFFTPEVRDAHERRAGFDIATLDGQRAAFARSGVDWGRRFGRYGVDLDALERVGVPAVEAAIAAGRLVVIDEIGKFELASVAFQRVVLEALRHHRVLFATILRGAVEVNLRAALGKLTV